MILFLLPTYERSSSSVDCDHISTGLVTLERYLIDCIETLRCGCATTDYSSKLTYFGASLPVGCPCCLLVRSCLTGTTSSHRVRNLGMRFDADFILLSNVDSSSRAAADTAQYPSLRLETGLPVAGDVTCPDATRLLQQRRIRTFGCPSTTLAGDPSYFLSALY